MSGKHAEWRSGEVLAFTEREGPGRPPGGPPLWLTGALSGVLAVTFLGLFMSDTLCPDHRAWVQALAGFAFLGVGAACVALWRGWAVAPFLTLAASLAGVAIGLLDAVHSPTRGRFVAVGFALAAVLAALMAWRVQRLGRWRTSVEATPSPAPPAPELPAQAPVELRAAEPVDEAPTRQ